MYVNILLHTHLIQLADIILKIEDYINIINLLAFYKSYFFLL